MAVNVTDGPQPLNSTNSLRDGFLVFAVLALIALFNAGLHWEIQNITKRSVDLGTARILHLDEAQMHRIHVIQTTCDLELIRLKNEAKFVGREKIEQLLWERDKEILKVLNGNQQPMLYGHCQDLTTVTQMLNED